MTHFSQQDNFSVAARVLGALFYYAPESAEAAPLVLRYSPVTAGKLSGLYQKRH